MPHVIIESRFSIDDQYRWPATEPTNTKPSCWINICRINAIEYEMFWLLIAIILDTKRIVTNEMRWKCVRDQSANDAYCITYPVANECHAAIVWPREMCDWCVTVVYQFNGPSSLVFDPHENDASAIARCQLLVRFIPFHQRHLHAFKPPNH